MMMFRRKQAIPHEFERDDASLKESDGVELSKYLNTRCPVCGQTEATRENLSFDELQDYFRVLKTTNKETEAFVKKLGKEKSKLRKQLSSQAALEGKLRTAAEKRQNLVQSKINLQQQIENMRAELGDFERLERQHGAVKAENKTLLHENQELLIRVQHITEKMALQIRMTNKIKKSQDDIKDLSLHNVALQQQVQEFSKKLKDHKTLEALYHTAKVERQSKITLNYSLHYRLKDLKLECERMKPRLTKYRDLKAEIETLKNESDTLREAHQKLNDKVTHDKTVIQDYDRLVSTKKTITEENDALRAKIEKLREELKDCKDVDDKLKVVAVEKEVARLHRTALRRKVRGLSLKFLKEQLRVNRCKDKRKRVSVYVQRYISELKAADDKLEFRFGRADKTCTKRESASGSTLKNEN